MSSNTPDTSFKMFSDHTPLKPEGNFRFKKTSPSIFFQRSTFSSKLSPQFPEILKKNDNNNQSLSNSSTPGRTRANDSTEISNQSSTFKDLCFDLCIQNSNEKQPDQKETLNKDTFNRDTFNKDISAANDTKQISSNDIFIDDNSTAPNLKQSSAKFGSLMQSKTEIKALKQLEVKPKDTPAALRFIEVNAMKSSIDKSDNDKKIERELEGESFDRSFLKELASHNAAHTIQDVQDVQDDSLDTQKFQKDDLNNLLEFGDLDDIMIHPTTQQNLIDAELENEKLSTKLGDILPLLQSFLFDLNEQEESSKQRAKNEKDAVTHMNQLYEHLGLQFKEACNWQSQINCNAEQALGEFSATKTALAHLEDLVKEFQAELDRADTMQEQVKSARCELEIEINKLRVERENHMKTISFLNEKLAASEDTIHTFEQCLQSEISEMKTTSTITAEQVETLVKAEHQNAQLLQHKIDDLETDLKEAQAARDLLQEKHAQATTEHELKSLQLAHAQSELDKLQAVKAKAESELDSLNQAFEKCKQAKSNVISSKEKLESENKTLAQANTTLNEQVDSEKRMSAFLRKAVHDISEQIELLRAQYRTDLASAKCAMEETQKERDQLKHNYHQKREELAVLDETHKSVLQQLERERHESQTREKEHKTERANYSDTIEALRNQTIALKETNAQQETNLALFSDVKKELKSLKTTHERLVENFSAIKMENGQLITKLQAITESRVFLEQQLQVSSENNAHLQNKLETLEMNTAAILENRRLIDEKLTEFHTSQAEKQRELEKALFEKLGGFHAKMTKLQADLKHKDNLETQINLLKQELETVKQTRDHQMHENDVLIKELETRNQAHLEELSAKLQQETNAKTTLESSIIELQKDLKDANASRTSEAARAAQLENDIEQLETSLRSQEKRFDTSKELQLEIESLQKREAKWKSCLDESQLMFQNQISSLSAQVTALKNSENKLKESLDTQLKAKDELATKHADIEDKLGDALLELEALKATANCTRSSEGPNSDDPQETPAPTRSPQKRKDASTARQSKRVLRNVTNTLGSVTTPLQRKAAKRKTKALNDEFNEDIFRETW